MNEKLTSLPLSKWLAERGFQHKSKARYFQIGENLTPLDTGSLKMIKTFFVERGMSELPIYETGIMAYDLLWDICIKYAKEIFGKENILAHVPVFTLIKEGKKEEAEKYIMDNSILK